MTSPFASPSFGLVGGNACLDLANTVGGLRGASTKEYLGCYDDLLAWTWQTGLLPENQVRRLQQTARSHPVKATRALERAKELRESIYAIFSPVAAGQKAPQAALDILNTALAEAMSRARIVAGKDGFAWQLPDDDSAMDLPLWAVAREAAELLTSNRLPLVRECAGDACGWLFLDTTRNHSRQWCNMGGCGNRAKVRRHRARLAHGD
jgi:predicted RNA-binding Zn ribbon-like protein